nr:MAG TPA: hypothetical protein [Caudoviricetes sp.]
MVSKIDINNHNINSSPERERTLSFFDYISFL